MANTNTDTRTKHDPDLCKMTFGRPKPETGCPRCAELAAGAPVRSGWYSRAADGAARIREIRAHDCKRSGCGTVCTAFDW